MERTRSLPAVLSGHQNFKTSGEEPGKCPPRATLWLWYFPGEHSLLAAWSSLHHFLDQLARVVHVKGQLYCFVSHCSLAAMLSLNCNAEMILCSCVMTCCPMAQGDHLTQARSVCMQQSRTDVNKVPRFNLLQHCAIRPQRSERN